MLGSILALVGGVVFLLNEKLKNLLCKFSVPFAAGILITIAILDLIPEAVEHTGEITHLLVLVSFLLVFSFEHLFFIVHHHDSDRNTINPPLMFVLVGDTIHNFIDGIAIAAAYLVDPAFGLVVALSSFLHEVPHEIGDFGVMLSAGWNKTKVFAVNLLSALSTFLGAIFVYFVAQYNESLIGILLSISAGLFLYLGANGFLPGRNENDQSTVGKVLVVIIGATLMIFLSLLLPHGHE